MKKMIKVYDVKITAGPAAGYYRIIGVADKATAEELATDCSARYGTGDVVIERIEEVVVFTDQEDMLNWLMADDDEETTR